MGHEVLSELFRTGADALLGFASLNPTYKTVPYTFRDCFGIPVFLIYYIVYNEILKRVQDDNKEKRVFFHN